MAVTVIKFEPYNEEEDVEQYFERLEMFLLANGVKDDKKVGHVLSGIGAKAYAILRNLLAPAEPKDSDFATIKGKLVGYYKPKPPVIGQRFIHQRTQKPGESINQFVMELRRLARTCDFGGFLKEALRDRLVCGLSNISIQKKLLSEDDLSLQRAIDIATAAEMAVLQPEDQAATSHRETEVFAVQQVCKCCGKRGHSQGACCFRTRVCYLCGKKGHLRSVCQAATDKQPSIQQIEQQAVQDNSDDDLTLWTITGDHKQGYHVRLQVNGKHVQMELDTGAAVSVISEQEWNHLFPSTPLEQYVGAPLRGYSGQQLEVNGQKEVEVQYGSQTMKLPLVVMGGHKRPPLLGRDWLHSLKLDWAQLHRLQMDPIQQLLTQYSQVFQKGVGTIVGYQADIKLKEGTKPIFKKCRSVAYALQPTLEVELKRLQEEGIIEPVQTSAWATPLVVVPKSNGKIRVGGDYKVTINRCVETKIYPLPTVEDIFAKLAGCSYFTKLDLTQAYQQLLLDDESKKLLVVNTPKGLFQFTRLPYGVSTAPAIFQSVMDRIL